MKDLHEINVFIIWYNVKKKLRARGEGGGTGIVEFIIMYV